MAPNSLIGAARTQNPKMNMGSNSKVPAKVAGASAKQNPAQHAPNVRTFKPHLARRGK